MFWRFNVLTSHIDTLLDRQGITLHELMDEDDILQECKAQNRKLLDFLLRREVMDEMVNMITENVENLDEKAKYSNTACELLTSDVAQIIDALLEGNVLLDKIYSFLESEKPLNPLMASFFSKVLGLLIARRGEYMYEYLKSKSEFVRCLLRHIGTSAIMDLLLRLITCVELQETKAKVLQWLSEESLIEKLVALIDPNEDESKHYNASLSLCDIVRIGREQMGAEESVADPLLDRMESDATITTLLNHMLNGTHSESVVTSGMAVVQTILEFRRQLPEGATEQLPARETERVNKAIDMAVTAILPRFKDLAGILLNPPKQFYSSMDTTVGVLTPPFGSTRIHVARLFTTLSSLKKPELFTQFVQLNVCNTLLDLFFQYHWNNFLHTQVACCVHNVLALNSAEDDAIDEGQAQIVEHLLKDCAVTRRIMDAWEQNDQPLNKGGGSGGGGGGYRRAYMGHLIAIANDIVAAGDKCPCSAVVKNALSALPEEDLSRWNAFVSTTLADVNKRNTSDLIGSHPLRTSSEDDDGDFRGIPFPQENSAMQQAFSDYQLQQMTSNFIDQFGFHEEEFTGPEERHDANFQENIANLDFTVNANEEASSKNQFEQACAGRIAAFDDENSSSDEDVWEDKGVIFESPHPQSSNADSSLKEINSDEAGMNDMDNSSEDDDDDDDDDEEGEVSSSPLSQQSESDRGHRADIQEKMDVDPAWTPEEEEEREEQQEQPSTGTSAVLSPWDTKPTKVAVDDIGWAAFSSEPVSSTTDEGWADFSKFKPEENKQSSDPGPRSSSPDSNDEMAEDSLRKKAYVVTEEVPVNVEDSLQNKEQIEKMLTDGTSDFLKGAGELIPLQVDSQQPELTDVRP